MDIHIDWAGPFTTDEASTFKSETDFGIYLYYGDHPVYGANVLLYIGKAEKQNFGTRVSQHNWPTWIPGNTELFFGRICCEAPIENSEWETRINLAERILIFSHSPAFNTSNLNNVGRHNGDEDVRILNWGKRKSLLPEASLSRWTNKNALGHDKPNNLNHCGNNA